MSFEIRIKNNDDYLQIKESNQRQQHDSPFLPFRRRREERELEDEVSHNNNKERKWNKIKF